MSVRHWLAVALTVAVAASAVAVVATKHYSRRAFVELQELQRERDRLDVEWGRLRIEQGAVATHGRVETIARRELEMRMPGRDDVIIVRRGGDSGGSTR